METPLDQLLEYRAQLTDAIENEPINSNTKLVALHQPDLGTDDGQTLHALTGVAYPPEQATIVTSIGKTFPPEDMDGGWLLPKYKIFVTFRRLVSSPRQISTGTG